MPFQRPARLILPLVLALCVCTAPVVRADTTVAVRKELQALYARSNAAFSRRDVPGSVALMAPDYYGTTRSGKRVERAQIIQPLSNLLRTARSAQARSTIEKLVLKGDTAVVTVREVTTVAVTDPHSGKPMTMQSDARAQDTWKKRSGKWLMIHTKQLGGKGTINGQPVRG